MRMRDTTSGSRVGRGVRNVAVAVSLVDLVQACKVAEESLGWDSPDAPRVYRASVPPGRDSLLAPENVVWCQEGDSVAAVAVVDSNGLIRVRRVLGEAPQDTVRIGLWRAGVRYRELSYLHRDSSELVLVKDLHQAVAEEILSRMEGSTDPDSFVSILAGALAEGDSLFDRHPFPEGLPVGTDTAAVLREAILELVEKGLPLSEVLPRSALPQDSEAIKREIRALADSGRIADTSRILPRVPDRNRLTISILSPAQGRILDPLNDSVEVRVSVSDPSAVDSMKIGNRKADTSGAVWKATVRVPLGESRIEVRAWDRQGGVVADTLIVRRMRDSTGPTVAILAPALGAKLPSGQDSVEIRVDAADPSGIAKVWVSDRLAVRGDGVWKIRLPLPEGTTRFVVQAIDSAGNATLDTAMVERVRDINGPSLAVAFAPSGASVPYAVDTVVVKVRATDSSGVDSVKIGGLAAKQVGDGSWQIAVALAVGRNAIAVQAIDRKGNRADTSVAVVRDPQPAGRDSLAPTISVAKRRIDLPAESAYVELEATIADDHGLAVVRFADSSLPVAGARYSPRLPVPVGTSAFRIVASDSAGNKASDSIVVVRAMPKDVDPPEITRASGAVSRPVPFDSSFVAVAWYVKDDRNLASVKIGDTLVQGEKGLYYRALPLRVDTNRVAIVAVDSAGNSASDTILLVRRPDTTCPIVVHIGSSDTTLPANVRFVSLSWDVRDNQSVEVGVVDGTEARKEGTIYTVELSVFEQGRDVVLEAVDLAGNITRDTVVVKVAKDVRPPLVVRDDGTDDMVVPVGTESVEVGWKVADDCILAGVWIDGLKVSSPNDSSFRTVVKLQGETTTIRVLAKDAAGNESTDSVVVRRAGQAEPSVPGLRMWLGLESSVPGSVPGRRWSLTPFAFGGAGRRILSTVGATESAEWTRGPKDADLEPVRA